MFAAVPTQGNGSLLLARGADDVGLLGMRAEALTARGVAAEALTARQLGAVEPHLAISDCGTALLVTSDAQLVCPSRMQTRKPSPRRGNSRHKLHVERLLASSGLACMYDLGIRSVVSLQLFRDTC